MRISIAIIGGALLLAGCGQSAPDPRGVARDETLLTTTGTARAEARPDEARFTAGIQTVADTGPAASTANARRMAEVVAAIRTAGVEERDIQTRQLNVARSDYGPNRGRFEANNVVAVRIRAIDRASTIVAAATGAGANVLSGPELRVADPEAATRGAYAQALRNARARADAYAEAAGLRVTRVLSIRDIVAGEVSPMAAEMVAPPPVVATAAPPVMAGTSEQDVRVVAQFALAER